jgi:hypothetical protein
MYTVYSVLLSPLWLKSVPGWAAISVSTFQQSRVGQIVWFGSLSAISQLASTGGGMGSWATLCLHSVTQPYTTCPRWREQGGGLRSLPLKGIHVIRRLIAAPAEVPAATNGIVGKFATASVELARMAGVTVEVSPRPRGAPLLPRPPRSRLPPRIPPRLPQPTLLRPPLEAWAPQLRASGQAADTSPVKNGFSFSSYTVYSQCALSKNKKSYR